MFKRKRLILYLYVYDIGCKGQLSLGSFKLVNRDIK